MKGGETTEVQNPGDYSNNSRLQRALHPGPSNLNSFLRGDLEHPPEEALYFLRNASKEKDSFRELCARI